MSEHPDFSCAARLDSVSGRGPLPEVDNHMRNENIMLFTYIVCTVDVCTCTVVVQTCIE